MRTLVFILVACLISSIVEGFSSSSRIITTRRSMVAVRRTQKQTVMSSSNNDEMIEPGIGDEGCKLPALSKVNTLPIPAQAGVFVSIVVGLYFSTMALISGVESLKLLAPGFMSPWMSTWPVLGAFYMIAGVAHFTLKETFINMYPAQGAWGFWYLPGSKFFHVAWTGVAEFVFGSWMVGGALTKLIGASVLPTFSPGGDAVAEAAVALLVLTALVTPANIYMYTHGAKAIGSPEIPVAGHAFRGFMQAVLLCFFYEMALPVIS